MLFGGSAFVGVDVRVIATKYCVVAAIERLQTENIGAGAVEGEENINVRAEVLLEFLDGRAGIRVVPVGNDMALIGAGKGFEDLGMDPGIVVAGEAAERFSRGLRHIAQQCSRDEL